MGVYIKGMRMPDGCEMCDFIDSDGYCAAMGGDYLFDYLPKGVIWLPSGWKCEHCPLVDVKEPHGRLVDINEVFVVVESETLGSRWGEEIGTDEETYIGKYRTIDDIDDVPTVIGKEG